MAWVTDKCVREQKDTTAREHWLCSHWGVWPHSASCFSWCLQHIKAFYIEPSQMLLLHQRESIHFFSVAPHLSGFTRELSIIWFYRYFSILLKENGFTCISGYLVYMIKTQHYNLAKGRSGFRENVTKIYLCFILHKVWYKPRERYLRGPKSCDQTWNLSWPFLLGQYSRYFMILCLLLEVVQKAQVDFIFFWSLAYS